MGSEETADPTTETGPVADSPTAGVAETTERRGTGRTVIETRNIGVHYGETRALSEITVSIPEGQVTALIGPSGVASAWCFKSPTRSRNRSGTTSPTDCVSRGTRAVSTHASRNH